MEASKVALRALRFEGQITGISTRADGGMGIRLVTPEFNSEEKTSLFELNNLLVEVLIYPKDSKDSAVVRVRRPMDGKSPSQRLHSCLFLLWKQEGGEGQFEQWYQGRMENIINEIKQQLPAQ